MIDKPRERVDQVAAAVRLGTCALSDALDARGVLPGVRALGRRARSLAT